MDGDSCYIMTYMVMRRKTMGNTRSEQLYRDFMDINPQVPRNILESDISWCLSCLLQRTVRLYRDEPSKKTRLRTILRSFPSYHIVSVKMPKWLFQNNILQPCKSIREQQYREQEREKDRGTKRTPEHALRTSRYIVLWSVLFFLPYLCFILSSLFIFFLFFLFLSSLFTGA